MAGFERNARNVALLTMASRVTGLLRDGALSRVFGAGPLMDAFFFAFMIPNLFRRLFGEGALAAAFLPVYAELTDTDPRIARQLASLTIARMLMFLGALTLIGEGLLFLLSALNNHDILALRLMMIMLPYMPLVCLVAVLGAMLQVHNRFGPTAAAPIILNIFIIAATVGTPFFFDIQPADSDALSRVGHITIVALSTILAGVVQVAWSLRALRAQRWWVRQIDEARQPMGRVMRQAGPMILGLGVLQMNTFFDGLIASYPATIGPTIFEVDYPLETGAMAAISYAQRLYQFPLGVFGIAIATAIFPLLSRQKDDDVAYVNTIRRGLRLTLFIGLPAAAGLILVREPLTSVIYQGGQFDPEHTARVSFVLLGYAPAIWAYSMTHVLTRAFYSRGDSRTPVRIAMSMVALNLLLNVTLIWTPLRESALAWSTATTASIQAAILLFVLRDRTSQPLLSRGVTIAWLKTIIATITMVAVVAGVQTALPSSSSQWSGTLIELCVLVIAGMVTIALCAVALRMPELQWAIGRSVTSDFDEQ